MGDQNETTGTERLLTRACCPKFATDKWTFSPTTLLYLDNHRKVTGQSLDSHWTVTGHSLDSH